MDQYPSPPLPALAQQSDEKADDQPKQSPLDTPKRPPKSIRKRASLLPTAGTKSWMRTTPAPSNLQFIAPFEPAKPSKKLRKRSEPNEAPSKKQKLSKARQPPAEKPAKTAAAPVNRPPAKPSRKPDAKSVVKSPAVSLTQSSPTPAYALLTEPSLASYRDSPPEDFSQSNTKSREISAETDFEPVTKPRPTSHRVFQPEVTPESDPESRKIPLETRFELLIRPRPDSDWDASPQLSPKSGCKSRETSVKTDSAPATETPPASNQDLPLDLSLESGHKFRGNSVETDSEPFQFMYNMSNSFERQQASFVGAMSAAASKLSAGGPSKAAARNSTLAPPSPSPSIGSTASGIAPGSLTPRRDRFLDAPAANIVYSQPAMTGTGDSIISQMAYAVAWLRGKDEPQTYTDVLGYLSATARPEHEQEFFVEQMRRNPQISWIPDPDLSEQTWRSGTYVHRPAIPDRRQRPKKDGAPRMVWLDDASLFHEIDPELKIMWSRCEVPSVENIVPRLVAAQQKPASEDPRIKAMQAPKVEKKKKRAQRRTGKSTNTHMEHLLKDYSHMKR
ncbi:transcription factor TFIIE beta subunit, TFIIEB, Tfa2 [Collariella sp. IMI 366227]|nr:transcription factor TFIIE beta subunit, TFIIEB, Tfa2 [Collariella sp. IMI 366227]